MEKYILQATLFDKDLRTGMPYVARNLLPIIARDKRDSLLLSTWNDFTMITNDTEVRQLLVTCASTFVCDGRENPK